MKRVVFIDFDGTITKIDTCFAMVKAFAKEGWLEINKLWEDKQLSTGDCANRLFKLLDANLSDVEKLMDTIAIDEYFKEFILMCRKKGYEIYVLSDGYDFNIKTIFKRYDIDLKYYANKLLYDEDSGFSMTSPYGHPECKECGTCKTNLIKELKGESDQVIYIGDGYSDMCAAEMADIVFAKGVLYQYCKEKDVNAICFSDFKDVIMSGLL